MKKALTSVLVMFLTTTFSTSLKAQVNLVSNPSFEIYDSCPNNDGEIIRAIGWYQAMPTVDYFNVCSHDSSGPGCLLAGVPSNCFGYRTPASGNAYAGAILYPNREAIGTELLQSLQRSIKYYVSFKVALSGASNHYYCGINKIGILFSTIRYDSSSPPPICNNCAQIQSDSIIIDTLNWTRITGSFVADSNYSFISIGRFNSNSMTDTIHLAGTYCGPYYFFDDFCISTDSLYAYNYTYTGEGINNLTASSSIKIFPNPAKDFVTIEDEVNDLQSLKLYDIYGRIIKIQLIKAIHHYELNLKDLPSGAYYLSIMESNSNSISQIIIKL